jgi:hypothetical protein
MFNNATLRTSNLAENIRVLDTAMKLTNAPNCIKVTNKHIIPPTCFDHSCGHSQGAVVQKLNISR